MYPGLYESMGICIIRESEIQFGRYAIREGGYPPRSSRPLRRLFAPHPALQPLPRFLRTSTPAPTFAALTYIFHSF